MKELQMRANNLLICAEDFITDCEKENVTNEQWFIEWEIIMSKLVTKDHNKN